MARHLFHFRRFKTKGYVGSAYQSTNIAGRRLDYAATGDGGNEQLQKCKQQKLIFSVLERACPDVTADEIKCLEGT